MNVWGDECLKIGRGWWMSEVMNVGVMNVGQSVSASQISVFNLAQWHNRWLSLGLSSRRTKSLLGSSGPYGREDPILFKCIQSQSLILEEQVKRFQTPIAFLFSISACSLTFSSNQFSLHVSHITFVSYSASCTCLHQIEFSHNLYPVLHSIRRLTEKAVMAVGTVVAGTVVVRTILISHNLLWWWKVMMPTRIVLFLAMLSLVAFCYNLTEDFKFGGQTKMFWPCFQKLSWPPSHFNCDGTSHLF